MDKLTSRKFILAVISAVSGVAISLSELDGKIGVICAVISAIVPCITYIVTEGAIDLKAVALAVEAAEDVQEILEEDAEDDNK